MKRPLRTVLFGGLATDNLHLLIFGQLIMLLPGLWRLLRHPWPGHWLEKFFWLFALLAVGPVGRRHRAGLGRVPPAAE